jgi:hypothetical protein
MQMASVLPSRARGDCVPLEAPPPPVAPVGARWYVGITVPRLERIARDQCSRAGVPTFLPLRELGPADPRACAPLYPGYLFMTDCHVPSVVTAARGIVSTAGGPIVVPPGMVERLMAKCDKDGVHSDHRHRAGPQFAVGDEVRILCGPLMGAFGTIARINGHHLRVDINLFSRNAAVDLRTEQVERAL